MKMILAMNQWTHAKTVGLVLPQSMFQVKYFIPYDTTPESFSPTSQPVRLVSVNGRYVDVLVRKRISLTAELELKGDTLEAKDSQGRSAGWSLEAVKDMTFKQLAVNLQELWRLDHATLAINGSGVVPSPRKKVGVWFKGKKVKKEKKEVKKEAKVGKAKAKPVVKRPACRR